MAKGTVAKESVAQKIAAAFGQDWIGEYDKKYYVWADDGGERIQVSIALTCPKVYRGVEETGVSELNFDDEENSGSPAAGQSFGFRPAEITQEEQDTLAELMNRLGL